MGVFEVNEHERRRRMMSARSSIALLAAGAVVLTASAAHALGPFSYGDRPIHPGCIHALAMNQGDSVPVTTAVSLEGCATSERSRSEVQYEGDLAVIEDEALLGGGSFGYRVINQLDNGIFGLAIRRRLPSGEERVSLAAVQLVARPMIRHGATVRLMLVELLGELWIPDMQLSSFQSIGNKVHFVSGVGTERVERMIDMTRIGKQRK
jgi:hypothetical protein